MNRKSLPVLTLLLLVLASGSFVFAHDQNIERCASGANCADLYYGLSHEQIASYPGPAVERLAPNQRLMHDRRYMQVSGELTIYDAPNGNVLRVLDAGFNFVTVLEVREDGWVQINQNEWVRAESLTDTNHIVSSFTGVLLPETPLEYPIGWLLVNLYPSRTPGGEPYEGYPLSYRYTMINIFATVIVDGFEWYQISADQWVHQYNVARMVELERPAEIDTHKWVAIDLYEEVIVAYEGDRPVFTTLTATGLPRWPTHEGVYHIYYRTPRTEMSWGTPGDDFYYLEEVPWTMFFDEGRALHGAYWHDGFGYRRSHGCVNLSITDARWLYDWVAEEFETFSSPNREEGPAVWVFTSGDYIE